MLTQSTSPRRIARIAALSLALLSLLTAMLAAAPAQAAPPAPAVLEGSVEWQEPPTIISNGKRIAYPWITVGPNDVSHMIYFTIDGEVMYTNNETGAFNIGGKRLDSAGTPAQVPVAAIAVGPNNVIGVAYVTVGRDNTVYFRQSFDGGKNWTPKEQISGGEKAASPHLAYDAASNAHIVWIDNRCGQGLYNAYYRERFANGLKSGTSSPRSSCSSYQNRPQITIAGGKPQVAFQHGASRGSEIYYARLEGNTWVNQNISVSNNISSQNATITSDGGNNIFIAWDENVGNVNHEIYFRASFDGGQTWTAKPINMSAGSAGISTAPALTWSAKAQRAIVVWQDEQGGSTGNPEIWERQFSPVSLDTTFADRISHLTRRSMWPTVGAGINRADISWQDEDREFFQAWHMGGLVGGPAGCDGSLVLNGGAAATRDRTLSGTITPANGCVPDQMQVSLDAPVTDATPKIAYNASIPLQTVPEGGCVHTVYVRLFKGGAGGKEFSDNIQVDSTVDAAVRMTNPHLSGLSTSGGLPGAQDGDERYTRDQDFFLGINDIGECSGLLSYKVQGGTNGAIPDTGFADTVDLPGGTTPAARNVIVTVTDKISNTQNFQTNLIYDAGAPTLSNSGNPTVTMPLSTTSIIVPLSFDNISVNDAIYGAEENLPTGKQFWGVWIAVSRTPTAPPTTDLARWSPVEVLDRNSTFTVNWSLFSGLPSPSKTAGDYYVFVKFLDGAGNFTTATLESAKITLQSDFTTPTLYVPIVRR
jgi:hypothetical protein